MCAKVNERKKTKSTVSDVDFDNLISELGSFGRFQIKNLLVLFIPVFLTGFHTFNYAFTAEIQTYRCLIPECETTNTTYKTDWLSDAIPVDRNGNPERCERYRPVEESGDFQNGTCSKEQFQNETQRCDEFVFEAREKTTIANEFNLFCRENLWKLTTVGTVHMTGQFFAMPTAGWFSDRYGRRTALVVGGILCTTCGILRSFSPTYTIYVILEFLDAFFGGAIYASVFVLGLELVDSKHRVVCSLVVSMVSAFGGMTIGFIAWNTDTWQTLLRLVYVPGIVTVAYYWLIPESLKWLLAKKRYGDFEKVILRAAEYNRTKLSDRTLNWMKDLQEVEMESVPQVEIQTSTAELVQNDYPLKEFIRNRQMVIRVIVNALCWICVVFVFYGMALHSVVLSGNKYMNYMMGFLVQMPSYPLGYYLLNNFGRRKTLMWAFWLAGSVTLMSTVIDQDIIWLQLILYMLGRCPISIAFTAVYVITTELYPTSMRQSLLGFCSMVGRFGSMVAPQMPYLGIIWSPLPVLCFGVVSILASGLVMLLPETRNRKLPDTIQDAVNLS